MTFIAAKAKLPDYIEHSDEEKITAVLLLLESDNDQQKHVYDEDTLNRLRKRSAQYLSGDLKTYSFNESMERMKQHRQANG